MSRRRRIRRARTSVLTFVCVSILAHWMIPWLLAFSVASNNRDDALRDELTATGRVGEEEALKHELLTKWEKEAEEFSLSFRNPTDFVNYIEARLSGHLAVSLLFGLLAAMLTFLPTAPPPAAHRHRDARRLRSHLIASRRFIDR